MAEGGGEFGYEDPDLDNQIDLLFFIIIVVVNLVVKVQAFVTKFATVFHHSNIFQAYYF